MRDTPPTALSAVEELLRVTYGQSCNRQLQAGKRMDLTGTAKARADDVNNDL